MRAWLFLIHPLEPFSHRDFHSKRLIPPKVMYLPRVREKEWKSETTQNQMVNFKMAAMIWGDSKDVLCQAPFTCAPCHRASFLSSSSCGQHPFQFSTSINYNRRRPQARHERKQKIGGQEWMWARNGPDGSWDEEVLPVASIVFYAPAMSLSTFVCFFQICLDFVLLKYRFG